jgi:exodeoxyribonuclease VII large subunit
VPLREVAEAVKGWIERLGSIWVSAQIIEIRRKANALAFITLRDVSAEVSVSATAYPHVLDLAGPVSDGMAVTVHLKPAMWIKSGRLNYEILEIRATGEGQLLAEIERRKRVLQAEGLFDPSRKRPLPFLPRRIGLITAEKSAAERDVLVNVRLRWNVPVLVRHCLMQGPSSAGQVTEALRELDADPSVDVIVIARGGGSLEDLLPFSDETLVRAAAAATTPIVSAIGHEIDTPILDLVADLRASTPTDAAKRIVPDATDEQHLVHGALTRLRHAINALVTTESLRIEHLRSRPVMRHPVSGIESLEHHLGETRRRLRHTIVAHIANERTHIGHLAARAHALSPQSTLERGYAVLTTHDGEALTSVNAVHQGDTVRARLHDGTLGMTVATLDHDHRPAQETP